MKFLPLIILAAAAALSGCVSSVLRASAQGRTDEVDSLLARGASIESKSAFGCSKYPPEHRIAAGLETPLICATVNHQRDTVKLLLEKGANVNARDYEGKTALDYASSPEERDDVIAAMIRARMEGRPIDTAAAPPPAAPAPEQAPAPKKQWYDK